MNTKLTVVTEVIIISWSQFFKKNYGKSMSERGTRGLLEVMEMPPILTVEVVSLSVHNGSNSSNCTLKPSDLLVCKLYLNKIDFKS